MTTTSNKNTSTPSYSSISTFIGALTLAAAALLPTDNAHACSFIVPGNDGQEASGPSFEAMTSGFLQGALDCGDAVYNLHVMTIDVDPSQEHVGVRDDPLFEQDITGALKPVFDVSLSSSTHLHILGRVNQFPRIGVRRGFTQFATLCDAGHTMAPLNCSWGDARIKFRMTTLDTNSDEIFDRNYHEMSIYDGNTRLHMVTFWTPHRDKLGTTAEDWISALKAFGLDIAQSG